MKKLFCYFLIASVSITSCKKDDNHLFTESPDERLNATLSNYQSALASSPTGWNATVIPGNGGIYHFHFTFNSENRVFMFSDFDTTTAKNQKESSYRLKALQQPSLIFDTYSYLHLLSDPDGSVNGGIDGQGLLSDFEFSLDSLYTDSILLTGRVNHTKVKLERATQQDLDAWQNGQWASTLSFLNIGEIENYFKRLMLGSAEYEIFVDAASRAIIFQWISGGVLRRFSTTFYFSANGVVLNEPLTNGSQTITGFTNISWNGNNQTLTVTASNTTGIITGAMKPLRTDLNAPQRWWQKAVNDGEYWESIRGFNVNGVDDAFKINTLTRFYSLIYYPEFDTGNDLFAPLFVNAAGDNIELQYGAAPGTPQFTGDGRAVFSLLGFYGPYPSTGPAAQSLAQLLIPEGYYFVQTSETSYDMISSVDAKTWITWSY